VGGAFRDVANALPFVHAVNATRAAVAGDCAAVFPDLWWVIGYAGAVCLAAVIVFRRKMSGN
jgi:ABC-2 type transport system permease protein